MPPRPQDQGDILYAPTRERVLATNAWAFLHWLAATHGIRLADWSALQAWSAAEFSPFISAFRAFARQPDNRDPARLRHDAGLLLHLDLRPDDALLVADASDWSGAARYVRSVAKHEGAPGALLHDAAKIGASVLIASAAQLDRVAFRLGAGRHDLARLRAVVALGGPMPANARVRLYTWVKSDLMLLARAGDTVWGDPLSPVLRTPPAQPALGLTLRPPLSPFPGGR
jgi:hypothetical protein